MPSARADHRRDRPRQRAAGYSDEEIDRRLDAIVDAMSACIDRGIGQDGILPAASR
jgi:L-serine deaminase